jgi:L-asparaginase / beta-aspartyl-peptidase
MDAIAIVVHGGAGGLPRDPERIERMRSGAAAAVTAGHDVLARGGSALDAVEAAVVILEDDPEFNAGRGAALTEYGRVELDASVMDGATRAAGAVAAVRGVRNPVKAARAVLAEGRHVLLVGAPATEFAATAGLAFEPETWFVTDRERRALNRRTAPPAESPGGVTSAGGVGSPGGDGSAGEEPVESAGGTVGAVARDARGRLAAATSTGGVAGQRLGRVGDSPLVGAGTWADDDTVAVSCTGHGESIIRAALAHEVDALLRHADLPLEEACVAAIEGLARFGGDGGLIAVNARGEVAAMFSSPAMTRAWRVGDRPLVTAVGPAEGG